MKINVASVLKNDGASQQFFGSRDIGKTDFMGSELVFSSPVEVSGKVLNIGGVIEISAHLSGRYFTSCSRCGKEIEMDLSADLFESSESDFSDIDGECISLSGNIMDITGSIDACIFGNMPLKFLCSEDCKGLCPQCGTNLNEKECNCGDEVYDPRFAIFRNLSKEV